MSDEAIRATPEYRRAKADFDARLAEIEAAKARTTEQMNRMKELAERGVDTLYGAFSEPVNDEEDV